MSWHLRTGSRKESCPACGHRTFKPYVNDSGETLHPTVGRCDRENSCRYHLPPSAYMGAVSPDAPRYRTRWKKPEPAPRPAPGLMARSDFEATMRRYDLNPLARWLHGIFDPLIGDARVESVFREMGMGTSARFGGAALFWMIDQQGRIRDGKVMGYDAATGKRVKKPYPQFTNVHTLLKEKYRGEYRACYFGAHRAAIYDGMDLPVWVFESEKAALIVALVLEWGRSLIALPVASGGCAGFNPTEANKADPWHGTRLLKGRKVVVFPDQGKFDEWRRKATMLRGYSEEVYIASVMERDIHPCEVKCEIEEGDGFDDLLIRYIERGLDPFELIVTSYGWHDSYRII